MPSNVMPVSLGRPLPKHNLGQSTFATAWAFIILADRTNWGSLEGSGVTLPTALLSCLALCVVARPSSGPLFMALLTSHLGWLAAEWGERVSIHGYASAVVEATILLVVVLREIGLRPLQTRGALEQSLVGPALLFVVGAMGAAGFAKLNRDFVDPESSCGPVLYLWLRESVFLSWLPTGDWVGPVLIVFTIVAELGGALLLLHRKTRAVGLALLVAVWLPIAIIPRFTVVEFTGVFFSASLVFAPHRRLAGGWTRLAYVLRRYGPRLRQRVALSVRSLAVLLLGLASLGETIGLRHVARKTIAQWTCVSAATLVVLLIFFGRRARWTWPSVRPPFRGALAFYAFVALLLLNEAAPYMGFWQNVSMTMAGNFWVQPAFSNHLVFQQVEPVAAARPITVVASNSSAFPVGSQMPWVLFKELAARNLSAEVTFRDGDRERQLKGGRSSADEPGSLLARMLSLRPRVPPRSGVIMCNKTPPGVSSRDWHGRVPGIEARRRSRPSP